MTIESKYLVGNEGDNVRGDLLSPRMGLSHFLLHPLLTPWA
jgi:hypothetical protein